MKEVIRQVLKGAVIIGLTFVGFKFVMSFKKDPKINELVESIRLVKIQDVELTNHSLSIPVYGHLKSKDEIDLFPEVGGVLKSEGFREGKTYNKGQVIAFIENDELALNVKSQKSSLLNQVAKLVSDLKFDFPETVPAWEGFLDNINFDKNLPQLPEVTDVKLKKYLAGKNIYSQYFSIQAQEDRLSKYAIVAPFDGVLSEAVIKPGTVVRQGQKIGKFINPSEFELEANVSLVYANKIKNGSKVNLTSNDIVGNWSGSVARINRTLSEASQNMNVFINVTSNSLYNGMYLFGDVNMDEVEDAYELKRSLLNKNKLFKVVDGELRVVEVTILQVNEETAIVAGLVAGDKILSEPIKGGYNGMKVRYNK
jgi:membrane fusion protein (multidrug efflux system)